MLEQHRKWRRQITYMHDHGHKQGEGIAGRNGGTRRRGVKRENWDNCNSIINKIY